MAAGDVEHFDRQAATYDESWIQRYVAQVHAKMLDLIDANTPCLGPQCIVDVGCGTGRLLRAAAARWPEARLIGVDPAVHMVERARQLLPAATFEVAMAEHLPLPDAAADWILGSISFHHWADQPKGVREAVRVLRPGGLLCFADIALPGWVARILRSRARDARTIQRLVETSGTWVVAQERCFAGSIVVLVARKQAAASAA
ncbi:MAG TPA: class I SAM-dependent methyltransferase [Rhodanobacteraceae bacterium]